MVDHDSSPPTEAWTAFQVTAYLIMLRRDVRELRDAVMTAKANDERFLDMERQFKSQQQTIATLKKYVGIAVAAALGALGAAVGNKMATRVGPPPPAVTSSVASTTVDRVPEPPRSDAGRP